MGEDLTLMDRIKHRIQNHPVAALILLAGTVVIGLGQVAGAFKSISDLYKSRQRLPTSGALPPQSPGTQGVPEAPVEVECPGPLPPGTYWDRATFDIETAHMGKRHVENFDSFRSKQKISSLFDGNVTVSASYIFFGSWPLWRTPGIFKGGSLTPERDPVDLKRSDNDRSDSGAELTLLFPKMVKAIGAEVYDDGPAVDTIYLRVTTGKGAVLRVPECVNHVGDVGLLGAASEDGITRAVFHVDHGTFELDYLTVVTDAF